MGRKRLTEGGKHSPRLPYVAQVEGTDLHNLRRLRYINGDWKEV